MKKWMLIPLLILIVIILISCQKQKKEEQAILEKPQEEEIFPVAEEVENKILSAMDNLAQGKVGEGANLLLDVVLLTKPREQIPDDFENIILAAKDQFQSGNIAEGSELASEALHLYKSATEVTEEKSREKSIELEQEPKKEEPSPVAENVRDNILSAREEFKKGNADKGVILILESLSLFAPRRD